MCFRISHRAPGPTREIVCMLRPPRLCPSPPLHPLPGTFPGCPEETWVRLPSQSARRRPAPAEATPSSSRRSVTASSFPTAPGPSCHLPQTTVVRVSLAFRFLQRKHLPCCVCWRGAGTRIRETVQCWVIKHPTSKTFQSSRAQAHWTLPSSTRSSQLAVQYSFFQAWQLC